MSFKIMKIQNKYRIRNVDAYNTRENQSSYSSSRIIAGANVVMFRIDAATGLLTPTGCVVEAGTPICVRFL